MGKEEAPLLQTMRMDKTRFSVTGLLDESDEPAYWQTQTPLARLRALELMRQVMYGYDPDTARMDKVFEVAQLERR